MIPLIIMAAGAAIQAGGAIAKGIKGAQRAKKMREAIENYDRQTLDNQIRGKVGVSTLGSDLRREEASRMSATSMDALASGGVRGMVGGVGQLNANNNYMQREIGADLDRQQQGINMEIAQDDVRIRQMQERREEADLAGMGREMESGRQDKWAGIGEVGQSFMSMGGMMGGMGKGGQNPTQSAMGQTPQDTRFQAPNPYQTQNPYHINASMLSQQNMNKYNSYV